jgi:hypothetical protein
VSIWGDMVGANGVTLPAGLLARLGPMTHWLHEIGVQPDASSGARVVEGTLRVAVLSFIALGLPNTLQILAPYEPALGIRPAKQEPWLVRAVRWSPSHSWAVGIAAISAAGILSLGQLSEFLYWQF